MESWALYDNVPLPIAVYRLVQDEGISLEYENAEFASTNLAAEFSSLLPWLLDLSQAHDAPPRPISSGQVRSYFRRRIAHVPDHWTLSARTSTTALASQVPHIDMHSTARVRQRSRQYATRSKSRPLYTEDDHVNRKINLLLKKARTRSAEDAVHVRTVLDHLSLPDRIGPFKAWPDSLWEYLIVLFDCPFISALYWGEDFKLIYNYKYTPLTGSKHPNCIGLPGSDPACWGEIWHSIGMPFYTAYGNGVAVNKMQDLLAMNLHGYDEEMYFNWSVIPIEGEQGPFALWNFVINCTDDVLNDRRLNVLRELAALTSGALTFADYFSSLVVAVRALPQDLPTMLVYACENDSDLTLAASVAYSGLDVGKIPRKHNSTSPRSALGDLLDVVIETRTAVICIDKTILAEFDYSEGWAKPSETALIAPIYSENRNKLLAIAYIGINPMKRLDSSYQRYLDLLFSQIGVGLANIDHLLTQIAQVQRIANMEASRGRDLEVMLKQKSAELHESQQQFVRMAEELPAGMYRLNAQGEVTYINPKAIELTGGPDMYSDPDEPFLAVHPEWRDELKKSWEAMVNEKKDLSYEVRCSVDRPDGSERWVAGVINVDKDANDEVTGLTGFLVDTSERRRAEYLINKRADDAQESKRQQEAFIDMTSHELRNPLSAIVQSVDLVQVGLAKISLETPTEEILSVVQDELSTLSNVDLCAQHMKRIIDDTINISKIESNLLVITPDSVNVTTFLENTLKLFNTEATMKGINFRLDIGEDLSALGKVMLDPARLSQILINLITNSIKFMSGIEGAREIIVSANTSKTPPFGTYHPPKASPSQPRSSDSPDSPFRTNGTASPDTSYFKLNKQESDNLIFLVFSVRDTGPGMSAAESKALFQRFSQCTPKTHVKYGGSGLGLYICRKLAELQGGEIKCESATGKGALFTFFVASEVGEDTTMLDITSAPRTLLQSPKKVRSEKLRALVVEDNLLNQKILQKQLIRAGYEVSVANHGLECLEQIAQTAYDFILLDREMPVCDGLECITRLRALELFPDARIKRNKNQPIFVIAISANARVEQVEEMIQAGADEYLTKPFRFPDLDEKIKRHFKL